MGGTCLDVLADNFWGQDQQKVYFCLGCLIPLPLVISLPPCHNVHMKRDFVRLSMEYSCLIFSTSGGMGPVTTIVYERITTLF